MLAFFVNHSAGRENRPRTSVNNQESRSPPTVITRESMVTMIACGGPIMGDRIQTMTVSRTPMPEGAPGVRNPSVQPIENVNNINRYESSSLKDHVSSARLLPASRKKHR